MVRSRARMVIACAMGIAATFGARRADATCSGLDCLLYNGGNVLVSPEVYISCVGWDCGTTTGDLNGIVTKSANGDGNGALPTLLRVIGGSKYETRLSQYYQNAPNFSFASVSSAVYYGGYYHDPVLVSGQTCTSGGQCASNKCVMALGAHSGFCASGCQVASDCDNGGSGGATCLAGACWCMSDAQCGPAINSRPARAR